MPQFTEIEEKIYVFLTNYTRTADHSDSRSRSLANPIEQTATRTSPRRDRVVYLTKRRDLHRMLRAIPGPRRELALVSSLLGRIDEFAYRDETERDYDRDTDKKPCHGSSVSM